MVVWSMSWFSGRDSFIVDEMLFAVLPDRLCRVADLIDLPTDWVDHIYDDTSRWTKTMLTTFSMYRDDQDRGDVEKGPKCSWCWWWPYLKNTFLVERECWILCNFRSYPYCNFIILFCTSTRAHIDVIIHVNSWRNQCKPWGILSKKRIKIKIFLLFSFSPKVSRTN